MLLTLESLVDIDGLLGTRLKVRNVTLGLAKCHGALVGNLDKSARRRYSCTTDLLTTLLLSSTSILLPMTTCRHSMLASSLQRTHTISCRSTYKGKVGRIAGRGLDQKLVAPAVQSFEALGVVDVVDEDAAVGAAVKGNAQRLEAFLAGRIPQLSQVRLFSSHCRPRARLLLPHLHGDLSIVYQDLLCRKVGANGGLVAGAKFLVDLKPITALAW